MRSQCRTDRESPRAEHGDSGNNLGRKREEFEERRALAIIGFAWKGTPRDVLP